MPTLFRIFRTVEATDLMAESGELAVDAAGSPRWGSRWPGGGPGRARRRGWRVGQAGRAGWSSVGG